MPLSNIIATFCEKTGFSPTDDLDLLLRMVNRAAKEVYEFTDLPGCLREVTLLVPPGNVVALPYYVGELRAMREYYSKAKIELKEMAPKYSYNPWPDLWRNWRILKKSPIQTCIDDASIPIILTIPQADSLEFTVTLVGKTADSNRLSFEVVFTAGETTLECPIPFTELYSVSKNAISTWNITLTSGTTVLAVIPNDRLESIYTIVDVSQLPATGENGTANRYIDVLYKEPLQWMSDTNDAFPCEGFDDAVVYKALEHYFSEQPDGAEKVAGYYQKCAQVIFQRTAHSNGTSQKEMIFAPNQYFDLYPRYPRRIWRGGVLR